MYFAPPADEGPLGIRCRRKSDDATEWNKKYDDIFSRVDTIHQRDRRTDRRTPDNRKDRAYSTQLNVYSPTTQTRDTEIIQQMHGRLPERPKPIYAGHPWL